MLKHFLFIFFILISCSLVSGEDVYLNYTSSSELYKVNYPHDDNNYTIITSNDNEIYDIEMFYRFGLVTVNEGVYYSNITFFDRLYNTTISEKYTITDDFLSKKVLHNVYIYHDDEKMSGTKKEYNVFSTSPFFSKTTFTFFENNIKVVSSHSSTAGYYDETSILPLVHPLSLTNINLSSNNLDRIIWVEYIKTGEKPKSYYIDQLSPILSLPYKLIQGWDDDNNILNVLLIISYFLKAFFFWIKVIYQSLFTIIILTLIAVIPFISYTQSNNSQTFISKMGDNYSIFFNLIIKTIKYIINMLIKLIELIPFI